MKISFEGIVKGDSLGAIKVEEDCGELFRTIWVPVDNTLEFPQGSKVSVIGELDRICSNSFEVKNATVKVA